MTLLSYLAAVTERLKLGSYILIAPLRNPLVLAKQVTTLDVMSKGRVILGLGLGWMSEEFAGSNIPIEERAARTDEIIRFLRATWSSSRGGFNGKFTKLGPTLFEPKPVQKQIPIWIGGESTPALKRAGRLGDGWLPNTIVKPREMRECVNIIAEEAESNGRSIRNITISCKLRFKGISSETDSALRTIERLKRVGVSHFIVDFDHESASDYARKIKLFSHEIIRSF
jgi:probable F420-dependent oxidoreductase